MSSQPRANARGRPRSFDTEKALDAAMDVFWRKGYEGTSIADLTEAMGINRPSLYAAFGDKDALFRRVLDRYEQVPAAYVREALQQSTARAVAEKLLLGSVRRVTEKGNPRGCLLVQGALTCGDEAEDIRNELSTRRRSGEKALAERLRRAQAEGDLAADANPDDLARYLVTVVHGIAVEAAGGASREQLERVARMALQTLGDLSKDEKLPGDGA